MSMVVVTCINLNNVRFDKVFDNEYLANRFINKCRRGKSLIIVAVRKEY